MNNTIFFLIENAIFPLIVEKMSFYEQLKLRSVCKTIKSKICCSNYKNTDFFLKIGRINSDCINTIGYDKDTGTDILGVYSKTWEYGVLASESNFTFAGKHFNNINELIDKIEMLMVLEFLIELLELDKKLCKIRHHFRNKRVWQIVEENDEHQYSKYGETFYNENEKGIGKGNLEHLKKTTDCFYKFNNHLKKTMGVERWFDYVKEVIKGETICFPHMKEVDHDPGTIAGSTRNILAFGYKVLDNYEEVKDVYNKSRAEFFKNNRWSRR